MNFEDLDAVALDGIARMEAFFHEIGMPTSIADLGFHPSDDDIRLMADKCTIHRTKLVGGFQKLGYDDVIKIYEMAR